MSFARQLGLLTTGKDVIGVARRFRDKNVKSWRCICDDRAEQTSRLHEQSFTHAQPSPDWQRAFVAFIIYKRCISVTSSPPNSVDASISLQCTAFAHLVSSQKVDTKKKFKRELFGQLLSFTSPSFQLQAGRSSPLGTGDWSHARRVEGFFLNPLRQYSASYKEKHTLKTDGNHVVGVRA